MTEGGLGDHPCGSASGTELGAQVPMARGAVGRRRPKWGLGEIVFARSETEAPWKQARAVIHGLDAWKAGPSANQRVPARQRVSGWQRQPAQPQVAGGRPPSALSGPSNAAAGLPGQQPKSARRCKARSVGIMQCRGRGYCTWLGKKQPRSSPIISGHRRHYIQQLLPRAGREGVQGSGPAQVAAVAAGRHVWLLVDGLQTRRRREKEPTRASGTCTHNFASMGAALCPKAQVSGVMRWCSRQKLRVACLGRCPNKGPVVLECGSRTEIGRLCGPHWLPEAHGGRTPC